MLSIKHHLHIDIKITFEDPFCVRSFSDSATERGSGISSLFEVSSQRMDQTSPECSSSLFPSFFEEVLLVGSVVEAEV